MANRKYRGRKCLTPGCDYKARCNGYCLHCYELMRYHERKKMENLSIITQECELMELDDECKNCPWVYELIHFGTCECIEMRLQN